MNSAVNSPSPDESYLPGEKQLMLQTIQDWPAPKTERVSYQSKGRSLIFGPATRVAIALECLPAGLSAISFSDHRFEPWQANENYVGEIVEVKGYLGAFRAEVDINGERHDVGLLSPDKSGVYDLILDLNDRPVLQRQVLPLGYFHCATDKPDIIDRMLAHIGRQHGVIYKPRYYFFDESICAHSRQQLAGCQRCLDVCPADAIESVESRIKIDPFLCQGCASCTQACPTGAISYAYPDRKTSLQRISQLINGYKALHDKAPAILFYQDQLKQPQLLQEISRTAPQQVLPFPVQSMASIGSEVLLATLGMGAAQIFLAEPNVLPKKVRNSLHDTVQCSQRLLQALSLEPAYLTLLHQRDISRLDDEPLAPIIANVPDQAWGETKREILLNALRRLSMNQGNVQLSNASHCALGSLDINQARCTLCQACVNLCPASALSSNGARLFFRASRCVQCGLCVQGCPEDALALSNDFYFNSARKDSEGLLATITQAHCIQCGEAFASQQLVNKSIEILSQLPDYHAQQLDLIKMCPQCRLQKVGDDSQLLAGG